MDLGNKNGIVGVSGLVRTGAGFRCACKESSLFRRDFATAGCEIEVGAACVANAVLSTNK